MIQICPKCKHQFDSDAPAIIRCQCGYTHQVSKQHDAKNAVICHRCFSWLWWEGDQPVIKTIEGKIIKPKTTKGSDK